MNRHLGLAVFGLALLAGQASANGFGYPYGYNPYGCPPPCRWGIVPGYIRIQGSLRLSWGPLGFGRLNGPGGYGYGPGGVGFGPDGVAPYQLGPWYQYWPYEAHFQTPALPMYPYWGAATLPNGSPVINPGYPGHGAVPSYWNGDK